MDALLRSLLADRPVGLWFPALDAGSSQVRDWSGHGLHAAVSGSPARRASLLRSNGIDFDGTNDRLIVPNNAMLDITGAVTLEALVLADAFSSAKGGIIGTNADDGNSATNVCYSLACYASGQLFFEIEEASSGSPNRFADGPTLAPGRPYHVAATRAGVGGNIQFFLDGAKSGAPIPLATADGLGGLEVWIGGHRQDSTTNRWWDGVIGYAAIYGRELRRARIAEHARLARGRIAMTSRGRLRSV